MSTKIEVNNCFVATFSFVVKDMFNLPSKDFFHKF